MSYEHRIGKWTLASLSLYVKDVIDTFGIEFFVEGLSKEIESAFTKDSAALKVTGPVYFDWPGEEVYKFEVLVILTDYPGQNESGYDVHIQAGKIAEALSQVIPVYRHGDEDPATQVGCLIKDRDSREFVRTVNYGVIEKDLDVRQIGVLAKYELELST